MIPRVWYFVATLTLTVVLVSIGTSYAVGMAKLSIKVVDEYGHRIEGAEVRVRFQGGGLEKDRKRGLTDEEGVFNSSGFSSDGSTGGGVDKDGYYTSVFHHDFYVSRFGVWQPWSKEITAIMRPIINPVPMYVRDNFFKIPIVGDEVGFDLEKADWVIPHGQGTHADFVFRTEREWDDFDNFDAKMALTFSNPLDGIQFYKDDGGGDYNTGSRFRSPRTAPESGYQSKLQKRTSRGTYGNHSDDIDDYNYIFRVRSEVDEDGKLKRAMYGKIRGDLKFSPGSLSIGMLYYLNPDYTRNLEFDTERNLFGPLPRGEISVKLP